MKTHYYTQHIIDACDNNHLTVDEIFEYVSKKFPAAWKSSIYRNVEELAEKWELKKILWASKKAYFEKNKWNHIHLVDVETGKIMDVDFDEAKAFSLPSNFEASNYDIKILEKFN